MNITGWYYLHANGQLIYERELGDTAAEIRESEFARAMWPFDPSNREGAWTILIESLSLGADKARVFELAEKWECDDADAEAFANRMGITLAMDGDQVCASGPGFIDLAESDAGFGETKLEAMADLCKQLGLKPSKMWGATFSELLKKADAVKEETP